MKGQERRGEEKEMNMIPASRCKEPLISASLTGILSVLPSLPLYDHVLVNDVGSNEVK